MGSKSVSPHNLHNDWTYLLNFCVSFEILYIHFVLFQIVENAGDVPRVVGAGALEPCDASDLSHHCSDSE